ncbi:energy transducer TonB [Arenimonas sp.]|uniref:energy transducer TonB n=1 Tax=Arenimonas sp. TaxID=1872635 RepID=UPI0025BD42EE|nr:energy transducer TonB [Arenimonas sp.]
MIQRSLPQPSPLAAVDAKRIAGNTLAFAIHAVVFGVLLVPSTWTPPAKPARVERMTVLPEFVPPPEIEVMPAPPEQPVIERPRPTTVTNPIQTTVPVVDSPPVMDEGNEQAVAVDPGPPVEETFEVGPPQLATLAYDVYPPPRYPRQALRNGDTGTVVLRVLVDAQGWPKEVEIETSSGHRELDRAARTQVLSKWRFHPATRQGRPIPAYALVPIGFNLP